MDLREFLPGASCVQKIRHDGPSIIMCQEFLDLIDPHVFRMSFTIKEDIPADPENISLFRHVSVMFHPKRISDLAEQLLGLSWSFHFNKRSSWRDIM